MLNFKQKLADYSTYFENKLDEYLKKLDKSSPQLLKDAMKYAVTGGGKRLRPVLCYVTAEMLGLDRTCVDNFALAIEMIHSYSLVHDDLPAMDNDDYRRGKLSTHKKFGEAFGVLAGDALLNLAIETCLKQDNISKFELDAIRILFEYSGYSGMIAGQVLDLQSETSNFRNEELLYNIYVNKTAKLIMAPILISSSIAKGKCFEELKLFGEKFGIMFQIADDILDVEGTLESIGKTPHKDYKSNKFTSISIYGIEGAKAKIRELYDDCKNILSKIPNSNFLIDLVDYCYNRKS